MVPLQDNVRDNKNACEKKKTRVNEMNKKRKEEHLKQQPP